MQKLLHIFDRCPTVPGERLLHKGEIYRAMKLELGIM
jgi:hypothetical protein